MVFYCLDLHNTTPFCINCTMENSIIYRHIIIFLRCLLLQRGREWERNCEGEKERTCIFQNVLFYTQSVSNHVLPLSLLCFHHLQRLLPAELWSKGQWREQYYQLIRYHCKKIAMPCVIQHSEILHTQCFITYNKCQ